MALALGAMGVMTSDATASPLEETRQRVDALRAELTALDAEAGEAAARFNEAFDRRSLIAGRLASTRVEIRATDRGLRRSRARLSERLVAIYVRNEPTLIEAVLMQGDLADIVDVSGLLQTTARSDAAVVTEVRERRRRLEALRGRLADDERAAARDVSRMRAEQTRVQSLLDDRRRLLAGAEGRLRTLVRAEEQRIARLAAAKRSQRSRTSPQAGPAGVSAGSASPSSPRAAPAGRPAGAADRRPEPDPTPPAPTSGHVFPIAGPSTFGDDWLASRAGGRYHEGIDLFAARGTPVVAVADGTLFRVGYSGISGYRLWLRDSAGTEFFYAHLDGYSAAAREGATVTAGTVIGYNGDTGDAKGTSPHVHFEIHPGGGGPVRPFPIVSAWPRVG